MGFVILAIIGIAFIVIITNISVVQQSREMCIRDSGNGDQRKIQDDFLPIPGIGKPSGGKFFQLAGVSDIHRCVSVSKLALASVGEGTHGFPGSKRRPAVLYEFLIKRLKAFY